MKVLLVAATEAEVKPAIDLLSLKGRASLLNNSEVYMLITGVGMVATAFALGKVLSSNKFSIAINAGIGGSFNNAYSLGEVVYVEEDCFAELGAEDGEGFLSLDELGFGASKVRPIRSQVSLSGIRSAKGITVNKVHGNESSISETVRLWNPDVESMEGAAFYYACNQYKLPSIQLRAVSNYVERRNRDSWEIGLAVNKLKKTLIEIIHNL